MLRGEQASVAGTGASGYRCLTYSDPFGLAHCTKEQLDHGWKNVHSDRSTPECQSATSLPTITTTADSAATTAEVCSADVRQAALSTAGTVLGVGAVGYAKGLVTLAASEGAWEVPAVTSAFARNAAFLPSFMALKQATGSGGTPNPFGGSVGRVYQVLKMVPGFGAGMEAGEAFKSCRRGSR